MKKKTYSTKILQFGEGNFLRAFVDWMVQKANDKLGMDMGIVIVQPLAKGMTEQLKEQDCNYHVILEGIKDGVPIREIEKISCVLDAINPYQDYIKYKQYFLQPELEFVISNTTEAGISRIKNENIFAQPPISFPGKVAGLLYDRYTTFNGAKDKGLHFICCELIENNASTLKEIVLELAVKNNLESSFIEWINSSCSFCNSLVDRIVPGFPKENIENLQHELSFNDKMLVTAEYFHLWAIEGSKEVQQRFPLDKSGLNVLWMDSLKAFRDKKVRILNGAHTALVPLGLLSGYETVKEAFTDELLADFIQKMIALEVLPNIEGDKNELQQFAHEILERFLNPYLNHYMKDISLNSLSKWMTRNYPSFIDSYHRNGRIPQRLSFSLASLLVLYSPDRPITFTPSDNEDQLRLLDACWMRENTLAEKVNEILSLDAVWNINLAEIEGLSTTITQQISEIQGQGIKQAIHNLTE